MLSNLWQTTVQFPFAVNLIIYIILIVLALIGIIGMILGVLLIADGIYMVLTHYKGDETQALNLPDGWIVIISASVLLLAAILAFILPSRSRQQIPRIGTLVCVEHP